MVFLDLEYVSRFRLGIAKIVFERVYHRDFYFHDEVSPLEDPNEWILADEIETGEECCIFLFGRPKKFSEKIRGKKKVVYFIRANRKSRKSTFEVRSLSKEFVACLNEESEKGFAGILNSGDFLKRQPAFPVKDRLYYKYKPYSAREG